MLLDRRGFLLSLSALLVLPRAARGARGAPAWPLRVAFVTPPDAARAGATRGARLGAEEAAHAAALFGAGVVLTEGEDAERLLDAGAHVIVGGWDDAACARLATLVEGRGALCLNVGASGDALRAPGCRRHTFHVAASDAMRRGARSLAAADGGEGTTAATDGDVVLWHHALEAFGAGQLNDRFRARFGAPMDADAWAAWLAVKVAAEVALRVGGPDVPAMLARLERADTRFDGHKGRPLSFRARDHQLRQPLYHVGGGATVVEVPARRREAGAGSTAEQLDRLDATTTATTAACSWSAP